MIRVETFRDIGVATRFVRSLEKMGLHPLLVEGSEDRYGRVTHNVLWTGVR